MSSSKGAGRGSKVFHQGNEDVSRCEPGLAAQAAPELWRQDELRFSLDGLAQSFEAFVIDRRVGPRLDGTPLGGADVETIQLLARSALPSIEAAIAAWQPGPCESGTWPMPRDHNETCIFTIIPLLQRPGPVWPNKEE